MAQQEINSKNQNTKNIFIIGAKSVGNYGGYETFVDRLTELHQNIPHLRYHLIVRGDGNDNGNKSSCMFRNAEVLNIDIPDIGPAQALLYDIRAWKCCLEYIRRNDIPEPIVYVLACRRWVPFRRLVKKIHGSDGVVYVNPDGHEWQRTKWSYPVRLYLRMCERIMVPAADLVICDSLCIQKYVSEEYASKHPETEYIAYGADTIPSLLADNDPVFLKWLAENDVSADGYSICCGRFVPENNFEIIIREYMKSRSERKLIIITTENERLKKELQRRLNFDSDPRIRIVSPVYDRELLKKIRENAYASIHGHMVGGTNPNLLEALASTRINLVYDICFNREVAADAALYWNKYNGDLAELIDKAERLDPDMISTMHERARNRISSAYSWDQISNQYEELFNHQKGL